MKWYYKWERKLRFLDFPNLMLYVTTGIIMAVMVVWIRQVPVETYIGLNRNAVFAGQVWRLISFIFVPLSYSLFTLLLELYLMVFIGNTLASQWGCIPFNLYYLLGIVGAIGAAMVSGYGSNYYLNLSLLLAFATLFPDFEFLLFFVLPVKAKYFAWVAWAGYALSLIFGNWTLRAAALFSLLHYFLFFGPDIWRQFQDWRKYGPQRREFRNNMRNNRNRYY